MPARGRLDPLIERIEFGVPPAEVIADLEHAVEGVQRAIEEMRVGEVPIKHYGG